MGIYNRDYYRGPNFSFGGGLGLDRLTPVVKVLIFANIAVFLLQIFIVREVRQSPLEMMRKYNPELDKIVAEAEDDGPEGMEKLKKNHPEIYKLLNEKDRDIFFSPPQKVSIVQEWLELDTQKVIQGQLWRLLTHAFCHDRLMLLHIVFNMLLLYWFGSTLESMYGPREFLLFYLTAAVVAALAFVGLDLYTGSSIPAIGASGAVMAVMMLYTMHYPRETICIFWFFPIEMRWIMAFYLIWDLHPVLLALSGDQYFTGVAHAAHLGGLVFGFLYAKSQWRLEPLVDRIPFFRGQGLYRPRQRPRLRVVTVPVEESNVEQPNPDLESLRVDELLQKIFESGEASLTEEERNYLRQASERIKNRSK